jgi:hypothetical protein
MFVLPLLFTFYTFILRQAQDEEFVLPLPGVPGQRILQCNITVKPKGWAP